MSALDKLNEAINIIKDVCNNNSCIHCLLNPNCNVTPIHWKEVKKNETDN